jgi:hypothetical protein
MSPRLRGDFHTARDLYEQAVHAGDRREAGERLDEARRIATETQSRPALADALRGLRELAHPAAHRSPVA